MIGLLLVEDDPLFRESVRRTVAQTTDIDLRGEAATLGEGLALLAGPPADVLLVEPELPDGSGLVLIRATRRVWPGCAIMVLTRLNDEERVLASLEAGASGYLLKDALASDIVPEIRSLHAGGSPISPMIARCLLRHFQPPVMPDRVELSEREHQVLALITHGHSMMKIAEVLQVSPWTVQTYGRRIYVKLGVRSKAAAISAAYRLGLVAGSSGL